MNMMINQVLRKGHYKRDPLDISDLVLWYPTDMFRSVLPTHHMVFNGGSGATYSFGTYAGRECMSVTGASSGANRAYRATPISPQYADYGGGQWGVSFWYYGRNVSGSNIMQFAMSSARNIHASNGVTIVTSVNSSNLQLSEVGGAGSVLVIDVSNLTANAWNHIVYTGYSTGKTRLYVNKVLKATVNASGQTGYIGSRCSMPNYRATCRLANVRLYGKQLDETDIEKLYEE